jgi:hypothetical protein
MTWLRGPGAVRLRRSRVRPWCHWKLPEARDRHADTLPLPGMFTKLDGPTRFRRRCYQHPIIKTLDQVSEITALGLAELGAEALVPPRRLGELARTG